MRPGYIAEPKIEFEDSVLAQLLPPCAVGVFSSSVRQEWQISIFLDLQLDDSLHPLPLLSLV